jgi:hypothetical protein
MHPRHEFKFRVAAWLSDALARHFANGVQTAELLERSTPAMGKTHKLASKARNCNKQDKVPLLVEGPFSSDQNEPKTLEILDFVPKYVYPKDRPPNDWTPISKTIILRRRDDQGNHEKLEIDVSLTPAIIISKEGIAHHVFPGEREELVERAIRKLALRQASDTGLDTAQDSSTQIIQVTFTLRQLRRELVSQDHGYKLSEIKEALEVLSTATISVSYSRNRSRHGSSSAVFNNLTYSYADGDEDGERSQVAVYLDTKKMELPDFVWVQPGLAERVAEAKGHDRLRLAALPPEEAQAIVSVRARLGVVKSYRSLQERPTLGLSGLLDREEINLDANAAAPETNA